MAEFEEIESYYKVLYNANYRFNDDYCLSYLTPDSYEKVRKALSMLRKLKEIDHECYHVLFRIYKHQYNNYSKVRYLDSMQPRFIAQKFIVRKKIRKFIFNRDGYKCLRCGTKENLTLDHINPVYYGGENKLSNLQTLCKSCNSWKGTKYKDYRNGKR